MRKTLLTKAGLIAGLFAITGTLAPATASASIQDLVWVGTWDSTGSGNPTGVGGPGMTPGQKYVIRASYDDTSAVTGGVPVLDSFFSPSGQTMSTIDLTAAGNSLDIFVPMEGLDVGTPFIYTQDESDHFPAFIPAPTLNFLDGSSISDPNNIIGLEYEGDFAGAGNNIIELFNTTPGAATPINMVSTVLNFGTGPAATDTNGLVTAAPVVANDTTVTYSSADLVKTTALSVTGNDLGAGRSDGETFLSSTWSVPGVTQANGVDIQVAIEDSGLTNTTDSTNWNVTATEAMTALSDGAQAVVDYSNASPTASVTAVADAVDIDFTLTIGDLDLAVNALIAGFEAVTAISALVDGALTSLLDPLLSTGFLTVTHGALEAAFGLGAHTALITVQDLAGATGTATVDFFVQDTGVPVPAPAPLILILFGLALLAGRASHKA